MSFFNLEFKSVDCKARTGTISTDNSVIETPVFMPVGTQGTVKAIEQRELNDIGFKIILGNTYHLYLRPGTEVVNHFGGLNKFINWDKSILTDSGGYQVFSLNELRKLSDAGVKFQSHIDGSYHMFTPENVIDTQRKLGSDIIMVLDECTAYPSEYMIAKKSADLSIKWAERCKNTFMETEPLYGKKQFLFGICQGSMYRDLRTTYIKNMIDIGFDGYAIGGLSVGEPAEMMYDITDICTDIMPENNPRYLMGVGTPENILEGIERGIDMFDCVLPTRNARNGQFFTTHGKINIRNAKYKFSNEIIDENINSYASNNFTLGYMRHLFIANEILGLQLATIHNLAFYKWLMENARKKIVEGNFRQWKSELISCMNEEND